MKSQDRARKAERYLRKRDEYWNNGLKYVGEGKFSKASEFLWGAVAQSIKAVAAMRNISVIKHPMFFHFMRKLSRELEDKELYGSFLSLNELHKNFYDEYMGPMEIQIYLEKAERFLQRVEEIGKRIEHQAPR